MSIIDLILNLLVEIVDNDIFTDGVIEIIKKNNEGIGE
jgi:hypothetical protein